MLLFTQSLPGDAPGPDLPTALPSFSSEDPAHGPPADAKLGGDVSMGSCGGIGVGGPDSHCSRPKRWITAQVVGVSSLESLRVRPGRVVVPSGKPLRVEPRPICI